MKKNRITDDDIIMMARQLKDETQQRIETSSAKTWQRAVRSGAWLAAASILGFLMGFSLRPSLGEQGGLMAQTVTLQQTDTVILHETVRDTIWQTRTIIRTVEPQLALQKTTDTPVEEDPEESQGCSVTCDNIPYELLANW